MEYKNKLVEWNDIEIGKEYYWTQLCQYTKNFQFTLMILNEKPEYYPSKDLTEYKVIQVINNCSIMDERRNNKTYKEAERIVIVEKADL